MILAGDVGGTKTHLALVKRQERRVHVVAQQRLASHEYEGLAAMATTFLARHHARVSVACFGVAGPVVNGRCEATNLAWTIDAKSLRRALRVKRAALINDLEALACGIETLPRRALACLNAGTPLPRAAKAVIAAGTGLGEAALVWDGQRYRAVPSEGGHTDFAPRNELEIELLRYLQQCFGHVSYERIVSGPGKISLYEFLRDSGYGVETPALAKRLASGDRSAVISEAGLDGSSPLCAKTLDLFVSIYGAEAGNLVLKFLAAGGLYIGGGIAPAILPKLKDGTFIKAFIDKGRFTSMLSRLPVHVVLEDKAALFGTIHYALRYLEK